MKPRKLIIRQRVNVVRPVWQRLATIMFYCMRQNIDVIVRPPLSSHMTQPLDVGMLQTLKQAVATMNDMV